MHKDKIIFFKSIKTSPTRVLKTGLSFLLILVNHFPNTEIFLTLCSASNETMRKRELQDKDFGRLVIKENSNARNIILYSRTDGVHITVPPGTPDSAILHAVDKFREKLFKDKATVEENRIDLNYRIDTEHFKLELVQGKQEKFFARSELGYMRIVCPSSADFTDRGLQEWLRKVVGEALRKNAKVILPPRLKQLSKEHHLPFNEVRINSSKGRWGSCSSQKNINLSFHLLLLPGHLIDYVLLHELCHTKEMNHGKQFVALLNQHTGGRALELRTELRKYKIAVF